jgi:hypothetical protein
VINIINGFHIAAIDWSSGDRSQMVNWNTVTTDSIIYHEQFLTVQQSLSEASDQALDVTTYFGAPRVSPCSLNTQLRFKHVWIGEQCQLPDWQRRKLPKCF